jgi:hypothetical protein
VQNRLDDKIQAVKETLGILFQGCAVTAHKKAGCCTFRFAGKAIEFGERVLASHDVDYALMACHAAITELKEHPELDTIEIGSAAPCGVDQIDVVRANRRKADAAQADTG